VEVVEEDTDATEEADEDADAGNMAIMEERRAEENEFDDKMD
jgi:hypothetical protein